MNHKTKNPHILIVEDDDDDYRCLRASIYQRINNPTLIRKKDGEECLLYLDFIKEKVINSKKPHLIILDINMPKVDGIEVLKHVKRDFFLKHIPIVMLITASEEKKIEYCYRYGANSFITKPDGYSKYSSLMETVGSYWFKCSLLPSR